MNDSDDNKDRITLDELLSQITLQERLDDAVQQALLYKNQLVEMRKSIVVVSAQQVISQQEVLCIDKDMQDSFLMHVRRSLLNKLIEEAALAGGIVEKLSRREDGSTIITLSVKILSKERA